MKEIWSHRFGFIFTIVILFALTVIEFIAAWNETWIRGALYIGAILWVAMAARAWFSKDDTIDKPDRHIIRIIFTFLAVLAVSSLYSLSPVKIALWINVVVLGSCSIVCLCYFRQAWKVPATSPVES